MIRFPPQGLEICEYIQVPGKTAEDFFKDKDQPPSLAEIYRKRMLAIAADAKSTHGKWNSLLSIPPVRAWLLNGSAASETNLVWRLVPRSKRARKVRQRGRILRPKSARRGTLRRGRR